MSPVDAPECLPLDDPRWLWMTDVSARLRQPLGGQHVAEHDINEALALGDLHCLCRYPTAYGAWERQLVSFLCWAGHELHIWSDGVMTIHPRTAGRPLTPRSATNGLQNNCCGGAFFPLPGISATGAMRIRGMVFYAWRPDLERRWSTVFPPTDPRKDEEADEKSEVDRLDTWLAELYRHDEWLFLSATAVHQDITARAKQLTAKSGKQVPGLSYTTVREGLNEKRKSRKSRK